MFKLSLPQTLLQTMKEKLQLANELAASEFDF